jgi:small subunit ribosomal protein S11
MTKKGIVNIYSSFNNTIIHVTDTTGAETISQVTAGMVTDKGHLQGSSFPAMKAAKQAVEESLEAGLDEVDIQVRAPGGQKEKIPGKGSQPAIRAISRSDIGVGEIRDVTPIPHDSCRKKGGKRGRRV